MSNHQPTLLVRGDRRWKADSHEETSERLREVFEIRGLQPPAISQHLGVVIQIFERQTHDMTEVHDQRVSVIVRVGRRSQQMQTFHSALANAFPLSTSPKQFADRRC